MSHPRRRYRPHSSRPRTPSSPVPWGLCRPRPHGQTAGRRWPATGRGWRGVARLRP